MNFSFYHKTLLCIYFYFFLFICSLFSVSSTFAEEKRSCTDELIYAVSKVEMEFEDEYTQFLDLRSSQADAKAKNIPLYLQNYECQLEYVCQVFENPSFAGNAHPSDSCGSFDAEKFIQKQSLDFSMCGENTALLGKKDRLSLCQKFIAFKKKSSFSFAEVAIVEQSGVENNAFLAGKLQGMGKRMSVLYEKTRLFVRNFNKVMSDVSCAIPDKSA